MQRHSRVVLNAKAADHALRIEGNFRSGSVERESRVGRVHILLAADGVLRMKSEFALFFKQTHLVFVPHQDFPKFPAQSVRPVLANLALAFVPSVTN